MPGDSPALQWWRRGLIGAPIRGRGGTSLWDFDFYEDLLKSVALPVIFTQIFAPLKTIALQEPVRILIFEEREASETSLPLGNKGPLNRSAASVTTRNNKWSAQAGLLLSSFSSDAKARCNVLSKSNDTPAQPLDFSFFWKNRKFKGRLGRWRDRSSMTCTSTHPKSHGWCYFVFRQPEPDFCLHRQQKVWENKRAFHMRGYCTRTTTPEYSYLNKKRTIFTFILVLWKLRDFKTRDIFKLYKEICS